MTSLKPDVRIFDDLEALSRAAAELFIEDSKQAVSQRRRFLVALSGGSTPMKLYKLLAQSSYRKQIDWTTRPCFLGR